MTEDTILGLILGGITVLTPIVFILAWHQQKMAKIIHGEAKGENADARNAEIGALKQLVHQQSIAIDDLSKSHETLLGEIRNQKELSERLGSSV